VFLIYWVTGLVLGVLAAFNLLLLLATSPRGAGLGEWLRRSLGRVTGRTELGWLRWWHLTLVVGAGLAVVFAYDFAAGLFACTVPGTPTDIGGFLGQGRALWTGTNPFSVTSCGGTIGEPDGLASVLLNGVGSLGGLYGIALVWGLVALALVPLTWWAADPDRRYLTLIVATSPIYFPLVSAQIDGASNALVPATVLLTVVLARRRAVVATSLGGFLATQRFPTLFPILGLSGSLRQRWTAALAALAVFAAGTGVSYLLWGHEFLDVVFLSQFSRHSFSLNVWGVLLLQNAFPSGDGFTFAQAVVTLALVVGVFFLVRVPLRAAAIVLTGVALLNQFLSFNILVWLLPVALVGTRPRWWLWGIAVVGALNYNLTLGYFAWTQGILWPAEVLDVLLTVLLLGLFVDLWRTSDAAVPPGPPGPPAGTGRATTIISEPEVVRDDAWEPDANTVPR
jgi:hypothetical protein